MEAICVFCGSSPGFAPGHLEAARRLGEALAASGLRLVYGGARVGLMGRLADAALGCGGSVVGVIPRSFPRTVSHGGLSRLEVVDSMHARKQRMFELSDAFVALPGGFGTLEEILEILTWAQLGIHRKPCGLINVEGYFDAFLHFLDRAAADGFIRRPHRDMLAVARTPGELLERLRSAAPPAVSKWDGADAALR